MTDKKCYTFAEMLVALRREYIKAYEILEKMKHCVKIDPSICTDKKEPFSSYQYEMRLLFHTVLQSIYMEDTRALIMLDVKKKGPYTFGRKAMDTITRETLGRVNDPDSESYSLDYKVDEECFSTYNSKHYVEKIYILEDKKEEFHNLLEEFKQLDICNVLEAGALWAIHVTNRHSSININGLGLDFSFCRRFYDIKYDAKKDLIRYNTKERVSIWENYNDNLEDILNTEIPSYHIPDYYLDIIRKSDVDLDVIRFRNSLGRRGTLMIASEDNKELVLSKVRK